MTTRHPPWSEAENAALVALYFAMLDYVGFGVAYNKAAMIRGAQNSHAGPIDSGLNTAALKARSKQSIEFKLMNATAAHRDLAPEAETMHSHGYRAMPNYQAALKDAMRAEIEYRKDAELQRRHVS